MEKPSIVKPLFILTAAAILIVVMRLAASLVLTLTLAALFATLLYPIYNWLKRKRVPAGLALLLTMAIMVATAVFVVLLVGRSLETMMTSMAQYSDLMAQRQAELQARLGDLGDTSGFELLLQAIDPATLSKILGTILSAAASVLSRGLLILIITVFLLVEGAQFQERMLRSFGPESPLPRKVKALTGLFVRYFGLRAVVNLITGLGVTLMLWILGVDYAPLWGVLTFFLSFVPYIGMVVALTPPVLLAYAESGLGMAVLVIILAAVINIVAENLVAPVVMGKGLSISPTVVFLSYIIWMAILGASGAFVAMPLTVAVIMALASFEETHRIAEVMGDLSMPAPETNDQL